MTPTIATLAKPGAKFVIGSLNEIDRCLGAGVDPGYLSYESTTDPLPQRLQIHEKTAARKNSRSAGGD